MRRGRTARRDGGDGRRGRSAKVDARRPLGWPRGRDATQVLLVGEHLTLRSRPAAGLERLLPPARRACRRQPARGDRRWGATWTLGASRTSPGARSPGRPSDRRLRQRPPAPAPERRGARRGAHPGQSPWSRSQASSTALSVADGGIGSQTRPAAQRNSAVRSVLARAGTRARRGRRWPAPPRRGRRRCRGRGRAWTWWSSRRVRDPDAADGRPGYEPRRGNPQG
jgi:hypothetical protein